MEGSCRKYHKNGRLEEICAYKNNELDGLIMKWRKDGKFWRLFLYENGVLLRKTLVDI